MQCLSKMVHSGYNSVSSDVILQWGIGTLGNRSCQLVQTVIDWEPWSMSFSMLQVSGMSNPDTTEMIMLSLCGIRLKQVIITFINSLFFSIFIPLLFIGIVYITGKEHNFDLRTDKVSTTLGVPYDYTSVMHYSKTSFNKDKEPTIVTKIPEFMDVIGQRMEFSDSDLLKLNRLYNCSTFMIPTHNVLCFGFEIRRRLADVDLWFNDPPLIVIKLY